MRRALFRCWSRAVTATLKEQSYRLNYEHWHFSILNLNYTLEIALHIDNQLKN